jgi:hypothetical protein
MPQAQRGSAQATGNSTLRQNNLGEAGWSWAASQLWIPTGEQSSLLTRIATANTSWCVRMKI